LEARPGKEIFRLQDVDTRVYSVQSCPDGAKAVSVMQDGTALLWDLKPKGWKPKKAELASAELEGLWVALRERAAS
jgi:hypothetical protein